MIRNNWKSALLVYSPVAIALLITVPRLVTAEFGLFDDPETLSAARAFLDGDWSHMSYEATRGRFRPLYWIQYTMVYALAGQQSLWFFVWNGLVFALITFELILLVRRIGGSRAQAWTTGFMFVLAGPVVENLYTISKPELLQAVFLAGAVLPFAAPGAGAIGRKPLILSSLLSAILIVFAAMTKETAVVMVPIAAAWLILALLTASGEVRSLEARRWGAFFLASVLAASIYFLLRSQLLEVSVTGGTYSNNFEWTVERFVDSGVRWAGWLLRDFAWLIPLALLAVIDLLKSRLEQGRIIAGALIWVGAWVALYLPWEFTVEYYMLPVALGASAIAGAILIPALTRLSIPRERPLVLAIVLMSLLLWLMTLPNNLSNARQQLAVDEANARLLDYLRDTVEPGGRVVVNIQQENEYVDKVRVYLQEVVELRGVEVQIFDPDEGLPLGAALIAAPEIHNQPLLAVRMGVIEDSQVDWNQSLMDVLGEGAVPAFQSDEEFRLTIIELPRLLCSLLPSRGYCAAERSLLDTRQFHYGWDVYQWEGGPEG